MENVHTPVAAAACRQASVSDGGEILRFHAGAQTSRRDRNNIICNKFHVLSFRIHHWEMKEMERSNRTR